MATPQTGLSGQIVANFIAKYTEDFGDTGGSTLQDDYNRMPSWTLAFGSGNSQADLIWHTKGTLADAATATHDLQSLTDAFGNSISFSKIKAILVVHGGTIGEDETLEVGAAASNVFAAMFGSDTDKLIVGSGGWNELVDPGGGYTVDATNKNLKVTHGGGSTSFEYRLALAGLSS